MTCAGAGLMLPLQQVTLLGLMPGGPGASKRDKVGSQGVGDRVKRDGVGTFQRRAGH